MSGSLSNHNDENTRETSDRRDAQRPGGCGAVHPQLIGALPAVPASEEPTSAPPRTVTSTEGASAPHARAPALHEALVRAHQDPTFVSHISRLLTKGGETAPHILWRAVHDLLEKGPVGREVVAWDVVQEICRQSKKNLTIRGAVPPLETIAHLVAAVPQGPAATFDYITEHLPVDALELLSIVTRGPHASEGAQALALEFVQKNYATLVREPNNLSKIVELIRDAVMRHDRMSLDACIFVRDRYEACRSWVGKEAEADALWSMRDQLTTTLLEAPERCEANLKIALLYPHEVPHPSLQCEPRRLTESERWILAEAHYLRQALGQEYAPKISMLEARGFLDSSYFVYMGAPGEKTFRGVQSFESRFDRDRSVLGPLARALDVEIPGFTTTARRGERVAERPPRTWINRKDHVLYQASLVAQACRCVAEHYWKPEIADRLRTNAREFLRAIMHEHPEALALAVPRLRDLGNGFFGEVQRLARDEALAVWRTIPEASGDNHTIRNALIVLHGFGSFSVDFHRLALDELALALRDPSASTMRDDAFAEFIAALRPSGLTSPALEAAAAQAILRFPETLVASHLVRTLGEVKAVDLEVRALVSQQACRVDLGTAVWLNYAHGALLCGVDSDTRVRIREVFEGRYDLPVRALSRWNPKVRASYRILMGALCPERIGDITPVPNVRETLFKSSLEGLVQGALAQLPDITMRTNHYIPWAPAIDGFLTTTRPGVPAVVLLIDGERYHSVNGMWSFRGFDGQSLLATKIFQHAGYPVLRVSGQLGNLDQHNALRSAVSAAFDHLADGGEVADPRLIVDPEDGFTEIAGKVLLYRPILGEILPHRADPSATDEIESGGVGVSQVPDGDDLLESEEGEGAD
jgi:hypothetical protein